MRKQSLRHAIAPFSGTVDPDAHWLTRHRPAWPRVAPGTQCRAYALCAMPSVASKRAKRGTTRDHVTQPGRPDAHCSGAYALGAMPPEVGKRKKRCTAGHRGTQPGLSTACSTCGQHDWSVHVAMSRTLEKSRARCSPVEALLSPPIRDCRCRDAAPCRLLRDAALVAHAGTCRLVRFQGWWGRVRWRWRLPQCHRSKRLPPLHEVLRRWLRRDRHRRTLL
jgi:hypothetical protein